jgi:2-keto-4-pentenoate hydratase/2-oxohepta-3-ene-1,7-dioic acid hydratase in catechol pathway
VRWVTYLSPAAGAARPGLVSGGRVFGLRAGGQLVDLLGDDGEALQEASAAALGDPLDVVDFQAARLLAPIPQPPSVRDFMAFEAHVRNARGGPVDPGWYELPVFYFSNPASIRGPRDHVAVPPLTTEFDYELEVAAVVGRPGGDLDESDAESYIAGYTIFCDWSSRDLQFREMTQRLGPAKGKDSATTLGPMLVTPDELAPFRGGNAYRLAMRAFVNGVEYSSGDMADIYWTFGQLLAYASRGTRLVPGDIIGSGTVGTGCILELSRLHGSARYPWLKVGDRVQMEIEQLGAIDCVIVDYPAGPS